jgi:hypothetical protein
MIIATTMTQESIVDCGRHLALFPARCRPAAGCHLPALSILPLQLLLTLLLLLLLLVLLLLLPIGL